MPLTLPDTRVLVAQAPLGHGRAGGAIADDGLRLSVGVDVRPSRMAIVVKLTLRYDPSEAEQMATIAPQQRRLCAADANGETGAQATELNAVHDFAHFKPQTDVLLQGGTYAAQAQTHIAASCVVTSQSATSSRPLRVERLFSTVGVNPAMRMPLLGAYLREPDGESLTEPVGPNGPSFIGADASSPSVQPPLATPAEEPPIAEAATDSATAEATEPAPVARFPSELMDDRLMHSWTMLRASDIDFDAENPTSYAAPRQRSPFGRFLASDAVIEMTGLCTGGEARTVRLPGYRPLLVCETKLDEYVPQMELDTLTVHTDDNEITLVWRAHVPLVTEQPSFEVRRVVVTLEKDGDVRPLGAVYRDLQRGDFYRAWEEQDIRGTANDWEEEEEDLELEMERYDAFDLTPLPTIGIERYAQISAELATAKAPRAAILASHEFSEDSWLLEDQGWMEKIGDAVMAGDTSLSEQYTTLYKKLKTSLETAEAAS